MTSPRRRIATISVIALTVASLVGPFAFRPLPAQAQGAGMLVQNVADDIRETTRDIFRFISDKLGTSATVAIINALDYFMRKSAYEAAVWVSTGGKGQGSLIESRGIGTFLRDTALGAAGEALGTLTDQGFLGFNLCDPATPYLRVSILLGIAEFQSPTPPRPRCEWSRIAANWKDLGNDLTTGEALRQSAFVIEPGQSELSVAFQTNIKVSDDAATRAQTSLEQYRIGRGIKSVVEKVTGKVKTPASVTEAYLQQKIVVNPEEDERFIREVYLNSAIIKGSGELLPAALSTFVNTLSGKLLEKAMKGSLFSAADIGCPGREVFVSALKALGADFTANLKGCKVLLNAPELAGGGGGDAARLALADLLTPNIQDSSQYDAVTEFTVCPQQFRTVNNCVMDAQFAAGVRIAQVDKPLTVADAINQGYLHGDWPLVANSGPDEAKNQDPYCFSSAYCYSNLVKLRKARVIPIGWEIAATKAGGGRPTLQEVITNFNNCSVPGEPELPEHAWCHLIDPNWVLKYPATQCRAIVSGPTLVSSEADLRAQVCVDTPSCVAEDKDGRCIGGWGYCVAEKNIWRMAGASCPTQFASCESFTGRSNARLSVLTTTVDSASCTAEVAGCRAYSTEQSAADDVGDWNQVGRVFLTKAALACSERDAGCRELYPKSARRNLLVNGSFERDEDEDSRPDRWVGNALEWSNPPAGARDGSFAVRPDTFIGGAFAQSADVEPATTYTLSFAARRNAGEGRGVAIGGSVTIQNAAGAPLAVAGIDTTCAVVGNTLRFSVIPDNATAYVSGSCRFQTPARAARLRVDLYNSFADAAQSAWVDTVQLEEGPDATDFHDTPFVGAAPLYLKAPPDWMGCTGDPSQPVECAGYAPVCRADEVGCQKYTPQDGSPFIPGTATDADACPTSCIGYAAYRQEPSRYDFENFPLYLIPSSARECSAAAVGCSEFTNLDTAARGGEAREYYTDLRACVKPPNDEAATFYTWEGSGVRGYQLKEWRLLSGSPVHAGEIGRGPVLTSPTAAADCTALIFSRAPGTPDYNPDCREFFDTTGNPHYRVYSKTIVVTEECHPYRLTELPTPSDGGALGPERICEERLGGSWQDNECLFMGYPAESRSCEPRANGCRLYTGNAGRNTRLVFADDFEGAGVFGWGPVEAVAISAEAITVGGHSLAVSGASINKNVGARSVNQIQNGKTYFLSYWAKGRGNLTIRFSGGPADVQFARGAEAALTGAWQRYSFGPVRVSWDPSDGETLAFSGFVGDAFIDTIELREVASAVALVKNSWTTPSSCDATNAGAPLPQAQLGCSEYRVSSGAAVALKSFSSLCRERAAGCAAFTDTQASDAASHETWNALCALAAPVASPTGCVALGKTVCTVGIGRQSCRYTVPGDAPRVACPRAVAACVIDGIRIVDGRPTDLVVVPGDRTRYLVPEPAMQCDAEKVGCDLVGTPVAASCDLGRVCNVDAGCACRGVGPTDVCTVARGEQVCRYPLPYREPYPDDLLYRQSVVQNNPRAYSRSLCTIPAVGCDEWENGAGGFSYFKDPGDRVCEYKENVQVAGVAIGGWFRRGTSDACDPAYRVAGIQNGIRRNGDAEYQGFAGSCPAQYSACTEFMDPNDVTPGLYPTGRPYPVIRSEELSSSGSAQAPDGCNNQVSPKAGCVLFDDTSNAVKKWSVAATNKRSGQNGFAPVAPVDCSGDSPPAECKRCFGEYVAFDRPTDWGKACTADADCRGFVDIAAVAGDVCRFSPADIPNYPVNDTNSIIKVAQDRTCAEWLACRSSTPTWDARAGRSREVCDAIGLCNAYRAAGDGAQCSNWVETPTPQIVSEALYRSRDVGVGGREFSGYAIPGNFLPSALSQVAVKSCRLDPRTVCSTNDNCRPDKGVCETSYRLVRDLGSCTGDDNSPCTVTDDGITESGTCFNKHCAQDMKGNPVTGDPVALAFAQATDPSCRAYPEPNAPFPGDPGVAIINEFGIVESTIAGFQNAKVCQLGETCECSYNKASYGDTGAIRYYGDTTANNSPEVAHGICQGGKFAGRPCDPDVPGDQVRVEEPERRSCTPVGSDGGADQASGGACVALSRFDRFQGLFGYCLEQDASFSLQGDASKHACLTWLPTDRLAGSVDIYNVYASAGYPLGSSYLCVEPELTKTISTYAACAEVNDQQGCGGNAEWDDDLFDDGAIEEVRCAPGYFVVMAKCKNDTAASRFQCSDGGKAPYRCVPKGSVHTGRFPEGHAPVNNPVAAGSLCTPENVEGLRRYEPDTGKDSWEDWEPTLRNNVPVYVAVRGTNNSYRDGREDFGDQDILERFDDCELAGVPQSERYFGRENAAYEFSCKLAVQVGEGGDLGDAFNKAWTNRLWSNGDYRLNAEGARTYTATCRQSCAADAPGPCPCEIGGREVCRVAPGAGECTATINPIEYISRTPLSTGALKTFGYAVLTGTPSEKKDPASLPLCQDQSNGFNLELPLPESIACSAGFAAPEARVYRNEGRPYLSIATARGGARGGVCASELDDAACNIVGGAAIQCPADSFGCYQKCGAGPPECGALGACVPGARLCERPTAERRLEDCAARGFNFVWRGRCAGGPRAGNLCENNDQCWESECVSVSVGDAPRFECRPKIAASPFRIASGSEVSPAGAVLSGELVARAKSRLQQLFAKTLGIWQWQQPTFEPGNRNSSGVQGTYVFSDESQFVEDVAATAGAGRAPKVISVGRCEASGQAARCPEGVVDRVTIDNIDTGFVRGGGTKLVTMKFFAYADPDHMPIKHVVIDWGDGSAAQGPFPGAYKNHRGWVLGGGAKSLCDNLSFGTSPGACDDTGPFTYTYSYSCPASAARDLPACNFGSGAFQTNCWGDGNGDGRNECVFTPRVQVKDNWGFCNGVCAGRAAGASCYDASTQVPPGFDECMSDDFAQAEVLGISPWTKFDGHILVEPVR